MNELQRPADFFDAREIGWLRQVSDWRGAAGIAHCWGVIGLTWFLVALVPNPLTVLLGIVVIGARQLGLGILSHDAAHFTLFSNRRVNDWAAEWLLSRPLTGGSIHAYRKMHLQHHAFTQQANDPDLGLSAPFPISRSSFRRKVFRDLTGQTGLKQYGATFAAAFAGDTLAQRLRQGVERLGPNLAINAVFLAGFTLAGAWYLYFLLWIVPALTWNRLITRVRNIGEHAVVPDNDDRLRNTRTTLASWWERIIVAPYRVNYHLEHHLVVNCPFYKLPDAHRMLVDKGLAERMEIQPDYRSMLALAVPAALDEPVTTSNGADPANEEASRPNYF